MSPALTKNEYSDDRKKEEAEEKEETQPRAKRACKKRLLNESEPQEARICKGWGNSIIL